jgi:phage terminase Nu1 subunit (DNA packaging protein)
MMTKPSARAAPLAKVTKERGRLAAAQADIAETKAAKLRGALVDAAEVEAEWSGVLRTVRAGPGVPASRQATQRVALRTFFLIVP